SSCGCGSGLSWVLWCVVVIHYFTDLPLSSAASYRPIHATKPICCQTEDAEHCVKLMKKLVDLSHTVEDGMITYKGIPAPLICDFLTREASKAYYAEGTTFHIGKIEMAANTGTYLDSPFHRYADGKDLSELKLEVLADLDAIAFHTQPDQISIGPELFADAQNQISGKAILIHTGWDKHWRTDQYFEDHPHLTEAAAAWLKEAGATLVGIDSYNIDGTKTGTRPAHSILLGADIPIVEHMCNLQSLPDSGFKFNAVPVKVKKFGTFPVRAYAVVGL
ncbi:MAG: cyclase family protein, partial [Phormidesmis sp.]